MTVTGGDRAEHQCRVGDRDGRCALDGPVVAQLASTVRAPAIGAARQIQGTGMTAPCGNLHKALRFHRREARLVARSIGAVSDLSFCIVAPAVQELSVRNAAGEIAAR